MRCRTSQTRTVRATASNAAAGKPRKDALARASKTESRTWMEELKAASTVSPSPRTAIIVPKVTITGLRRRPSISAAFSAPTAAPARTAAGMAISAPQPLLTAAAATVEESRTTEPTDRSMPPTRTTRVIPSPSTSTGAVCFRIFCVLAKVPKTGAVTAKASSTAIAAIRMPCRCTSSRAAKGCRATLVPPPMSNKGAVMRRPGSGGSAAPRPARAGGLRQ